MLSQPPSKTHRSPCPPKKVVSWPSPQIWRTLIPEVPSMTSLSAGEARANLGRLIDQVNADSEPVTITGPRGNAVPPVHPRAEGIDAPYLR